MLGSWGAFWMAWGVLHAFTATGRLAPTGEASSAVGFWFIALAAITWVGALGARTRHTALATVFAIQAAGATLAAIGNLAGSGVVDVIAGWVLVAASICAWYAGSAELLEACYGREVLAVGRPTRETPRVVSMLPHARRAS